MPFPYLEQSPDKQLAVAGHEVADDLAVQPGYDERQVRPEHEEAGVAEEQAGLLAGPARDHDAHEAEELVQEGQVEAGLGLGARHVAVAAAAAAAEAGDARRVQEQPAMGLKGQRLGGRDDHLGRAAAIGHVYGARAVLVVQPRVGADQLQALLPLQPPPMPPAASALGPQHDRRQQRDRRQQPRRPRRAAQSATDHAAILADEGGNGGLGGRLAQRGLGGHGSGCGRRGVFALRNNKCAQGCVFFRCSSARR